MDIPECLVKLKSENKIDREAGSALVEKFTKSCKVSDIQDLIDTLLKKFGFITYGDWKEPFSYLVLIKSAVSDFKGEIELTNILQFVLAMLHHLETRVRLESTEVISKISELKNMETNKTILTTVVMLIQENLDRKLDFVPENASFGIHETDKLFNDTCGWRFLETSLHALNKLFDSCDTDIVEILTVDTINIITMCSRCVNRFVRETSMYVLDCLIGKHTYKYLEGEDLLNGIVESLYICMCDNWSQVRLAASTATRRLLLEMQNLGVDVTKSKLLPPVCLNRHYLAEGVKIYNAKTWEIVTLGKGPEIVKQNISEYVNFDVSQASADNHAVREASCHCLTELACILGKFLLGTHLAKIFDCLMMCFKDDSWPVRDTACWALGVIVASHSDFFSTRLNQMLPLFTRNLIDSIQSVRIGGAISLTYAFNSLPEESEEYLNQFISEHICQVKLQPNEMDPFASFDKGPARFGVVKSANDPKYCDQIMYSCGSLAPKMKSGLNNQGGCSSHGFTRVSHPWEVTEGCFIFLGEMAKFYARNETEKSSNLKFTRSEIAISIARQLVETNLIRMKEALGIRTFELHINLYQTFFTYFADILCLLGIESLDSPTFTQFIDVFCYAFRFHDSAPPRTGAEYCLQQIVKKFGKSQVESTLSTFQRDVNSLARFISNVKFI